MAGLQLINSLVQLIKLASAFLDFFVTMMSCFPLKMMSVCFSRHPPRCILCSHHVLQTWTLLDSSMTVAFLLLLPLVKLNDQQQRIEKPSLKKRDSGESQYHRMVNVGRDLWRSPGSTPRRHGLGNYCKMHSYFKVRSEYEHLEREKLP